eukprot:scaffold24894_cov106-Isochrysis_galbana.AAC.4
MLPPCERSSASQDDCAHVLAESRRRAPAALTVQAMRRSCPYDCKQTARCWWRTTVLCCVRNRHSVATVCRGNAFGERVNVKTAAHFCAC